MNRRQKIIVSVVGIFIVLLALVGLTYAYFLTRIQGNTNTKSISISTANLSLVYGDGNGIITPEKAIVPGDVIDSKTFTVTNEGNTDTDYVVVIDDVKVTFAETVTVSGVTQTKGASTTFESNDFVYTLTCESVNGCNSIIEQTPFPINGGIMVGNRLKEGETHEYSLTLTYKETGENQTNDMNKTLEARVNIADITSINPYSDNTDSLAYNIINNASRVTSKEKELGYAELVGTPYTKVTAEISEIKSSQIGYEVEEDIEKSLTVTQQQNYITYATSYTINPETGKFNLVDPKTCKYDEENCIRDLVADGENIYLSRDALRAIISSDGTVKVHNDTDYVFKVSDAPPTSDTAITIKLKRIINTAESVISTTQDEYGTSYYYRGAVKNNYVNFNRMCWRIVRIEGDGSVKLILADSEAECSEETITKQKSSIIGVGSFSYTDDIFEETNSYDYISPLEELDGEMLNPYDPEDYGRVMMHIKKAYDTFLNGGEIKYTENGIYKADGTDEIITKSYTGFSEESLDLLKSEQICIGDKKIYEDSNSTYMNFYSNMKRLYIDKYASLMCHGGELLGDSKIYPLTIDEVVLAGGIIDHSDYPSENFSYYLRENAMTDWWLASYAGQDNNSSASYYMAVADTRVSTLKFITENLGIRPVVSLIPNVELISGDGTIANPYVVG